MDIEVIVDLEKSGHVHDTYTGNSLSCVFSIGLLCLSAGSQ